MTDNEEIMALILNFLITRGRWGGKYYNRQKMTRYLGIQVLNDGKRWKGASTSY